MSGRAARPDPDGGIRLGDAVGCGSGRSGDPRRVSRLAARSDEHATVYEQTRRVWNAAPHLTPALAGQRRHPAIAPQRRFISRRQWLGGAAAAASVAVPWAISGNSRSYRTGTRKASVLPSPTAARCSSTPIRRCRSLRGDKATDRVAARPSLSSRWRTDPARPSPVAAGDVEALALGTRFEVRRDDAQVAVSVVEGAVPSSPGARRGGRRTASGEAAAIALPTGAVRRMAVAPDAVGTWREGRLVVDRLERRRGPG